MKLDIKLRRTILRGIPMVFLLSLCTFSIQAQSNSEEFVEQFQNYQQQTPIEKVYLHTNREALTLGDTLWFSLYLVNGKTHQPGTVSRMVYVELISPIDEVLRSLPIRTDSLGRAFGEFALADSLNAGNYQIRAYTNYQRNFDADFFFNKQLRILPRLTNQKERKKRDERPPEIDFQLFPEGGTLVSGLVNFVAFKVTDQTGLPISLSGKVVDDQMQEITTFETLHDGMGKFQLIPEKGKRYACVYDFQGINFSSPLPAILDEGYAMSVRQTREKIYITVKSNEQSFDQSFLLLHQRGVLLQAIEAKAGDNYIYTVLEKSVLPEGIIHATFFDGEKKARLERLVYHDNPLSPGFLDISISNPNPSTRSKVELKYETHEEGLAAYLSTVILPASVYEPFIHDIRSYLLFTSDLKGYIHRPAYYTDPTNPDRLEHIDLLMMTHGWRRFDWGRLAAGELPEINYFVQVGFTVEGEVSGYINRRKKVETDMYLSFLEKPDFIMEARSNPDGRFWFDGLLIDDSLTVFVKSQSTIKRKRNRDKVNANTFIEIFDRSFPEVEDHFPEPQLINEEGIVERGKELFDIESAYGDNVMILDEIAIEVKEEPFTDPFEKSVKLYGQPDSRVVMDSLTAIEQYSNVFDMIRGKVPGAIVEGSFPNYKVTVRNAEAILVYDGIPVDAQFLINIQPTEVLYVDILRGFEAGMFGAGAQGAVAFYSRSGAGLPVPNEEPLGFRTKPVFGFFAPRTFYMPNYTQPSEQERVMPDYRSTLFWLPDIRLEGTSVREDFYTSDEKGLFYLITEGISVDGRVLRDRQTFTVR